MSPSRKPKKAKNLQKPVPVWTYDQAQRLVPFLTSVMRSLREHQLEVQKNELDVRRLTKKPGRPDRATLIAEQEAVQETQRAWERYDDALAELQSLGIFCLDAITGEALVPFEREGQLAWFLFDLFDSRPFRFWRFDSDNLDTRRPIRDITSRLS
jgi:hypothetical protein